MKKIAAIVQLPVGVSPGQRFRVELWEPILRENGFSIDTYPFLDIDAHRIIYRKGHTLKKILAVCRGFIKRILLLPKLKKYDFIIVQREFAPLGPPIFEWICARMLRLKIIYDFDDAIWISNTSGENKLANWLKAFWKVKYICKWAYKVVPGNDYLAAYARQFSNKVHIRPTCVNTAIAHNRLKQHGPHKPVIGWTGSHSTLKYLDDLVPALQQLQKELAFTFLVIADKDPQLPLKDAQFISWNAETEIPDLLKIDIGVMPLPSDKWSEGKCGFKLIQYMALGIPAVASPVGVNSIIIEPGINGYLCTTIDEWVASLKELITDINLRTEMGSAGRIKIESLYSIRSQTQNYLQLFH